MRKTLVMVNPQDTFGLPKKIERTNIHRVFIVRSEWRQIFKNLRPCVHLSVRLNPLEVVIKQCRGRLLIALSEGLGQGMVGLAERLIGSSNWPGCYPSQRSTDQRPSCDCVREEAFHWSWLLPIHCKNGG